MPETTTNYNDYNDTVGVVDELLGQVVAELPTEQQQNLLEAIQLFAENPGLAEKAWTIWKKEIEES